MNEITHHHTARPYYKDESDSHRRYIRNWSDENDGEPDHYVDHRESQYLYPVVFDIETTAETPQRPILVSVYDEKAKRLTIAYNVQEADEMPSEAELEAHADKFEDCREVDIRYSCNMTWFEDNVLRLVHNDDERVLVAHNAFFDLGILAQPNDELVYHEKVQSDRWDGCFEYNDMACLHHRAGAYGRMYNFRAPHTGEFFDIPVADTMTVCKSLFLPASLEKASELFGIEYADVDGEHGVLNPEYIEYNVDDVRATYELFHALKNRMRVGFNSEQPLHSIYSTASIAKDILARMDYDRVHYTERALEIITPSYFGGNTEALKVGELVENVAFQDILSQYPTVCALTDVWDYMQAERITVERIDVSDLPAPSVDDLREPEAWKECAEYYVILEADGATLPVRTALEAGETTRVYNANVTHGDCTTTHHYFDYLAAQLHADGDPDIEIVTAFKAKKHGQQTLTPTKVGGTKIGAYDNIMKRGIEERKRIQWKENDGEKDERTMSLKIMANSSYGISAERIVEEIGEPDEYGYQRHDIAGKYYNPHVASTITAGGRLQLALGEHAARQAGGEMYYCDTDSLITDAHTAESVRDAYANLNPYDGVAGTLDVLEVEEGYRDGEEIMLDNVDLFAVGEKKYAIMDKERNIVKNTEHGLGHYNNLRDSDTIRKFWETVYADVTRDFSVGAGFDSEKMNELVFWDTAATTATSRRLIDDKLNQSVRYGDFIQRTISTADSDRVVNYIGIDLHERAIAIEQLENGEYVAREVEDIEREGLKTVKNVVAQFATGARVNDSRPDVKVTDRKVVTKEASDVVDEWDRLLNNALNQLINFII